MKIEQLMRMGRYGGDSQHMTLLMHIISHVKINAECWEWQGSKRRNGYGDVRFDQRDYTVTRVICWLSYQFDIDNPEIKVCHSCDNPKCINPRHLFLGSHQDNMTDMMKKFRSKGRRPIPNERDLIFISALEGGDEIKIAGDRVGYSHSYARTVKSILIPYWKATGVYPKRKER